jgi:hypothetical protein
MLRNQARTESSPQHPTAVPAPPLLGHGLARLGVVDVGGHVKLQEGCVVLNDVLGSAVLLLLPQPVVGLDDVRQLVGQVILRPANEILKFEILLPDILSIRVSDRLGTSSTFRLL